MNILNSLKLLLIGDTRIKTLVREQDIIKYDIKVVPIEGGQTCHIIKEIHEQLSKEYYSLLVIAALQNDMTLFKSLSSRWKPLSDSNDVYMRINNEFKVDKFVNMIVDQNNKWQTEYQDLHIVWLIPAVPDFIRYNEHYKGKHIKEGDILGILGTEQKIYDELTKKLVKKFHEHKLSYLDLNKMTRFQGKRLKEQRNNRKNSKTKTWIDPVMTVDGLHPQTRMAERFIRMLSQIMKYHIKKRKENIKAELLKRAQETNYANMYYQSVSSMPSSYDSYSTSYSDFNNPCENSAITSLRDKHIREWEFYRSHPHLHPSYNYEKATWMNERRAQGSTFWETYYNELEFEWWNHWLTKLNSLDQNEWMDKERNYRATKAVESSSLSGTPSLSSSESDDSDSGHWDEPNSKFNTRLKKFATDENNEKHFKHEKRVGRTNPKSRKRLKLDSNSNDISSDIVVDKNKNYGKENNRSKSTFLSISSTDSVKSKSEIKINNFRSSWYPEQRTNLISIMDSLSNGGKYLAVNDLINKNNNLSEKLDRLLRESRESVSDTKHSIKNNILPIRKPVLSKHAKKLLDLTSKLGQISDQFGTLGISLPVLHVKALEYVKKRFDPIECIDEDVKILLEIIGDKIKQMIEDSEQSGKQKSELKAIDKNLASFLASLGIKDSGYELGVGPYYGLEISSLIRSTRGLNKTDIINFVKTLLKYRGYHFVSYEEMERIYLEIRHYEIELPK